MCYAVHTVRLQEIDVRFKNTENNSLQFTKNIINKGKQTSEL